MRVSCIECVAKHAGSGAIFLSETPNGYADHLLGTIGDLEHVSQESIIEFPHIANMARQARKYITYAVPRSLVTEDMDERKELMTNVAETMSKLSRAIMAELMAAAKEKRDISPGEFV